MPSSSHSSSCPHSLSPVASLAPNDISGASINRKQPREVVERAGVSAGSAAGGASLERDYLGLKMSADAGAAQNDKE